MVSFIYNIDKVPQGMGYQTVKTPIIRNNGRLETTKTISLTKPYNLFPTLLFPLVSPKIRLLPYLQGR